MEKVRVNWTRYGPAFVDIPTALYAKEMRITIRNVCFLFLLFLLQPAYLF
jgi:hypothetical protein